MTALVLQHLGELHAYERILVGVVAFGPFVLLAAVLYVVRRRDPGREDAEGAHAEIDQPP